MNETTKPEGSRHHCGGPRKNIPTVTGIIEGVKCMSCKAEKVATVPGRPLFCLVCGSVQDGMTNHE